MEQGTRRVVLCAPRPPHSLCGMPRDKARCDLAPSKITLHSKGRDECSECVIPVFPVTVAHELEPEPVHYFKTKCACAEKESGTYLLSSDSGGNFPASTLQPSEPLESGRPPWWLSSQCQRIDAPQNPVHGRSTQVFLHIYIYVLL